MRRDNVINPLLIEEKPHYPTTVAGNTIRDPAIARWLFADTRSAWLWLILRVWLGYA